MAVTAPAGGRKRAESTNRSDDIDIASLREYLIKYKKAISVCYERALDKGSTLSGKVDIVLGSLSFEYWRKISFVVGFNVAGMIEKQGY